MKENQKKAIHTIKKPEFQESEIQEFDLNEDMDFGGLPDRDLKKNLGCG